MVTQDASQSIQDKHKIMQDIDTNSYLTQPIIESKHIKQDTILERSQVS
jgi:hypothetical protein